MGERKTITISTEEAKRQNDIMNQMSQHIKGLGLKYHTHTFGCLKV